MDPIIILFDFSIFEWINVDNFEMELFELISSDLKKTKFKELRKNLEDDYGKIDCYIKLLDVIAGKF